MNLLAIDTTTDLASVALSTTQGIFSEEKIGLRQHAKCLLSMVSSVLAQASMQSNQLDGLVFGCGPGSFTGLRIACSVIQGLSLAHDLPIFPVSSLLAIAYQASFDEIFHHQETMPGLLVMLDARMHEVYWEYFSADMVRSLRQLDDKGSQLNYQAHVSPANAVQVPKTTKLFLAGSGYAEYIPQLPTDIQTQLVKQLQVLPSAEAMIQLARSAKIKSVSAEAAEPLYVRNHVTQGAANG